MTNEVKKTKSKATPGQADWKRSQAKYNAADELGTPMPESLARRRTCRACAEQVEAKSYWYCNTHNALSLTDDDNLIYSAHCIDVESY